MIFDRYHKSKISYNLVRSGENTQNDLNCALIAFDKKDYIFSSELLANVLKNDSENYTASFYLGLSYIETGKTDSAIQILAVLANNNNHFYTDQSRWYLSMCYIKEGKNRQAVKYLEILYNEKNGYYKTQAGEIFKILKKE